MDYLTESEAEHLRESIKDSEGLSLTIYKCQSDKVSCGYGRNLSDNGISKDEAEYMLTNDIDIAIEECIEFYVEFWDLPYQVKHVLIDMMFNGGRKMMASFKRFNRCCAEDDFEGMARELKDSRYYHQVGRRGKKNYDLLVEASLLN
tara:strand:+ start:152 stop:592 length:441 start_codon:yes stop_codon:yes gene_type:complete